MGVRSDVAVALKKNVWDDLSEESKHTIKEWFDDPEEESPEGHVLFHGKSVKWYHSIYEDLAAFYKELFDTFDDADYLIIQANHDYPDSTHGDCGDWWENPWQIYRNIEVSITWN